MRLHKKASPKFVSVHHLLLDDPREELSRPRPHPQHRKSSQDSFSSFLSFFLRFASSIGGTNLEPISGTFSTIGNFSQTKCISFFPNLDNESKRNGRRDSSGTQHPPIHITVIVLRTLRRVFFFVSAGLCTTRKFVLCRENSNIFLRKSSLLCIIMRENTRKNTQRITSSSGEGVATRARKRKVGERDSLWDLVVNNDDICFKHILPRLSRTDVKFLYDVNTETRKLIKRSSRESDLRKMF